MHSEREQYEETMKKACMRGVCALKMEAMHMFKEGENEENCDPRTNGPAPQRLEGRWNVVFILNADGNLSP